MAFEILEKTQYSEKVFKFRVHAPQMAKKAQAGQFLIVRMDETGERVPFTFADWNPEEGWVEFIFMVIGATTEQLSQLQAGEEILDITGPLGKPTEMVPGNWCVIGGGVGLAIAYPVARALLAAGNKVTVIMGARTKDLLILTEQFRELPLENLIITTDDGSEGEKGVVTAPLERLCQDKAIDQVFAVGPVPMMKFSALTCEKYDMPITASLNPIMVDGTGMCGCCRVTVDGQTKFACVDGPDFDATKVDWADLSARQGSYRAEEKVAMEHVEHEGGCKCHS
ncbi:sulfide/dihydroorotate dehydrogenase-like FAD/NAD-binding protein [Olsenella sp. YH-ols2217]|uniref:Sulfide/dihydroorotate dehydrogenase-like FAD/NAD-binding protein n=1 Tax=Kribbibacterium absianum TaxID=3044210 RepID=A0ABT6ZMK8_9ACTN|nr:MULTISPECIES: sulfide/dihydroorotate dehydrogenase-like FAD/NAD-binding protein [unclassified Olsenella]MDJ1122290.1 sulfide/dihydroorotate dehydrogenase-like FAD/NAD-binding protein [Olsenella sp. YH-ols2216]MDJ1130296.1 sulfide/dihydroorotate dehydrogenase-like FAD/NAD-binding protein [Olsenella sp. YH-ols2217]